MMKRITVAILSILGAAWAMVGCVDSPSFPSSPMITDVRIELGANPVIPGDTASFVFILVDFTDGNGDIGHSPEDSITDLFIRNTQIYYFDPDTEEFDTNRIDTLFYSYLIPVIPPNGGVPDISGTIRINLLDPTEGTSPFTGPCLISNNRPEGIVGGPLTAVRYQVWFKDRAGNFTEIVDVPPIPIDCD